MKRNFRRSLLTRFFGMYQVRIGSMPLSNDESKVSDDRVK